MDFQIKLRFNRVVIIAGGSFAREGSTAQLSAILNDCVVFGCANVVLDLGRSVMLGDEAFSVLREAREKLEARSGSFRLRRVEHAVADLMLLIKILTTFDTGDVDDDQNGPPNDGSARYAA